MVMDDLVGLNAVCIIQDMQISDQEVICIRIDQWIGINWFIMDEMKKDMDIVFIWNRKWWSMTTCLLC